MLTFKVAYLKTVPAFSTGKEIFCNDYRTIGIWKGSDEVRETAKKKYLVVAGSAYYGNSQGYADHVFEILDAPDGLDISGRNHHNAFNTPTEKNQIVNITFANWEELEEVQGRL